MGAYSNLLVDHIVFILLAIVLPALSLNRGEVKLEGDWNTRVKSIFYFSNSLVLWFGAFFILGIWFFTHRSFVDFGFRIPDVNVYVILFTSVFIALYIYQMIRDFYNQKGIKTILEKWKEKSNMMPRNSKEFLHYGFLCFSAGVAEEIIFRGFLMNYILALSPSGGYLLVMAALFIPALVFGLIHMYQGMEAVQKIVIGGLIFGAIYYYSGSLLIVMILHFLVDIITGFYLMNALNDHQETVSELPSEIE